MSFDEQPDGDPHGECAAEIHRLENENRELKLALQDYMDAVRYADKQTLMSAIAAADKRALQFVPRRLPLTTSEGTTL